MVTVESNKRKYVVYLGLGKYMQVKSNLIPGSILLLSLYSHSVKIVSILQVIKSVVNEGTQVKNKRNKPEVLCLKPAGKFYPWLSLVAMIILFHKLHLRITVLRVNYLLVRPIYVKVSILHFSLFLNHFFTFQATQNYTRLLQLGQHPSKSCQQAYCMRYAN